MIFVTSTCTIPPRSTRTSAYSCSQVVIARSCRCTARSSVGASADGGRLVRSELTYLLVRLDKEYAERRPDQPWEEYYARGLLDHFAAR